MSATNNKLRSLPGVDTLLNSEGGTALVTAYGRAPTLEALRHALDAARAKLRAGDAAPIDNRILLDDAAVRLRSAFRPTLRPVINATGIIIHTNLGRAPLSDAAQQAMLEAAAQ
jgi:L-seryl-tRNA(Ser) seleniumtransferase